MPPLYKVTDVATILGVKASTIYGWVDQGKIPHIRVGRLVRFTVEQVAEFIRRSTRGSVQLHSGNVRDPKVEKN